MLGRKISELESGTRRLVYRTIGMTDINVRLKWDVLWDEIRKFPKEEKLYVLDAGCGNGRWLMEIAALRPNWICQGVDINSNYISEAKSDCQRLGLININFVTADFANFHPLRKFNIIISVSSLHYAIEKQKGQQIIGRIISWLKPGGTLLSIVPRLKHSESEELNIHHENITYETMRGNIEPLELTKFEVRACFGLNAIKAKQLNKYRRNQCTRYLSFPRKWLLYILAKKRIDDVREISDSWFLKVMR